MRARLQERVSRDAIDAVLTRANIVELVGARVDLKRAGALFKAPCPFHHDRTPSFVVTPARGTYHCFGCGAHGNAIGFLMAYDGLPFRDAVLELANSAGFEARPDGSRGAAALRASGRSLVDADDHLRRSVSLRKIWTASRPIGWAELNPVTRYLDARGVGAVRRDPPSDLRIHPALPYYDDGKLLGQFPALIAPVRDVEGRPVSLHRIYLTAEGAKAPVPSPKKLCRPISDGATRGGAIRLYAATERLAVTEGIETGFAVRIATGWPVWAAISAGGMANLIIPDHVHEVVVWGDADSAGRTAGTQLAARLACRAVKVKLIIPEAEGDDWLDVLLHEERIAA